MGINKARRRETCQGDGNLARPRRKSVPKNAVSVQRSDGVKDLVMNYLEKMSMRRIR